VKSGSIAAAIRASANVQTVHCLLALFGSNGSNPGSRNIILNLSQSIFIRFLASSNVIDEPLGITVKFSVLTINLLILEITDAARTSRLVAS
jgi:hypothetical protein